ncbi:helicase-related protein [Fodinicurvata fenggangensis]|uniref:helicase-related protein n=1 Tax=Fodinicurvata fenggangensis TaxID=1121830 RepID=UPI0006921C70|nr:helicase-related protein [Fodinicurvata fenggangensis]
MSSDRVVAVLGPTNTGKTFFAIERMLAHSSGMIGFPLRLLARENYDRVVKARGERQVALITGEEKIIPETARYFICTVESMPVTKPVDFLAVDEIQLAADPERGHIFTDRLLHARGTQETLLLGSETIRPLLHGLIRNLEIVSRPRFSKLTYAGQKKLNRLPPRSAVVTFSVSEVYALAEMMRRQRGGTAVVLGALSPRTRNAQVEMFESGEVDYLVATDAIGMGLNLGLDHVAFARLSKFDGHRPRRLSAPEVGQIAGRAGRHMNDGTFGTTADQPPMEEELIEAVEEHQFPALNALYWRNRELDFTHPKALLRSLERRPERRELMRVRPPDDQAALSSLLRDGSLMDLAQDRASVELLWDVCQVPDFRKTFSDNHVRLLSQIFRHLRQNDRRLPEDWVARQINRIARTDGDIDALIARIAHVRTWTFITHRGDWLADAKGWQERTRAIEDQLSDALHARLTNRFVDKRTATLLRRLRSGEDLLASVRKNGEVLVEGEEVGHLEGFRFRLDASVDRDDSQAILSATRKALQGVMPQRLSKLEEDNDGAFQLDDQAQLLWRGTAIARLAPGDSPLTPRIQTFDSEFLDGPSRERIRRRLADWLNRHLRNGLAPLYQLEEAPLKGAARGLAFQVAEAMGSLPRSAAAEQVRQLDKADRKALAGLNLRLGVQSLFLPALLKPRSQRLRALLWCVFHEHAFTPVPDSSTRLLHDERADDPAFCQAIGYRSLGRGKRKLAVRVDSLEQVMARARQQTREGVLKPDQKLRDLLDGESETLRLVLGSNGYQAHEEEGETVYRRQRNGKRKPARDRRKKTETSRPQANTPPEAAAHSPFAVLKSMKRG